MTKSYLKVVLMGVVALLLCYFNKAYSLYIMLLFIFVCAINAYQLESHYQRMGRFFQREKDNEIKEVEIENKYLVYLGEFPPYLSNATSHRVRDLRSREFSLPLRCV